MDDWRLHGQERYLTQVELYFSTYETYSDEWDHDHCEFCSGKFATQGGDFTDGYTTKDQYHWICGQCFRDFKSIFDWKVISCTESASEEQIREQQ
jgi:hypothetical protein